MVPASQIWSIENTGAADSGSQVAQRGFDGSGPGGAADAMTAAALGLGGGRGESV
jgi:hypothetical protein